MTDVDQVGERIEQLLSELSGKDAELAEDLVHTLLEFYGAGLARIVDVVGEANRPLLERVTEALDKVRPYLGSHAGDVEFVGIDDNGVLRLQLQGTCDGCPSSTVTAKYAIERMVREVAPEISDVVVEGVVPEETGPGGRPLLPLEALECPVEVR
jgi:Fe-S cluster biogenesis protein NfuA